MKIFLAAPYTDNSELIVSERVKLINKHAARLMEMGHIVFSPISHSHYIAIENALPTTFKFWQNQNHEFLRWCDCIVILKLPGWRESIGVADEIHFALDIGKKIIFMTEVCS